MSCNRKQPSPFPGRTHPRACICAVCAVGGLVLDCWLNEGPDSNNKVAMNLRTVFTIFSLPYSVSFESRLPGHLLINATTDVVPGNEPKLSSLPFGHSSFFGSPRTSGSLRFGSNTSRKVAPVSSTNAVEVKHGCIVRFKRQPLSVMHFRTSDAVMHSGV